MRTRDWTLVFCLVLQAGGTSTILGEEKTPRDLLVGARRIVFLGDSITAEGRYVACFDAWLETQKLDPRPVVIDAGLPSETVSGLSEEGHAGGQFPRPDLAERLDRVLKITRPDLVIACYGMNCGIYLPFDDQRFERYQKGIRHLKEKVEAAGANLVLITPPCFDDQQAKRTDSYNAVLARYSKWLLDQRNEGWHVADLHTPMTRELAERRKVDANFTFQPDAVHPNQEGFWVIASQLIAWFGDRQATETQTPEKMLEAAKLNPSVLGLIEQRVHLLRDAYVGAAGHKRPGIAAGLPVAEAEERAEALTEQIRKTK